MITQFGSLYAGNVEMEDIGLAGTPVNDRRYSNEHLVTALTNTETMAKVMDHEGYDVLWLAEHHFQPEGYEVITNIPMISVHLANITERLRYGAAFNVAPAWNPLRLAEDFATADILTGGRVIFGVGRGYHVREVETFGSPLIDADANRELFEEQVEIILKAFNEESFSHHGKQYDIPPAVPYRGYELEEITLVPRPLNLPVETWQPMVSVNPRGLDFMAKHRIKALVAGGVKGNHEAIAAWRDAQSRQGVETELGENVNAGFGVFIADTEEKAIAEAQIFFEESMKMFGPLGFVRGLTPELIEELGDPKRAPKAALPTLRDMVDMEGYLCGPPELIVEKLMEVQDAYPGLNQVHVNSPICATPMHVVTEQLEWFARDVMPAFKKQVRAGAPADD